MPGARDVALGRGPVAGGGCFREAVVKGVESPWERIRLYRQRATRTPLVMALRGTFLVGVPGRRALEERLPSLRDELRVDLCILNGENLADGVGITPKLADKMLASGVDAITLGNHTWRRSEIVPYLEQSDRVIRPANYSKRAPGSTRHRIAT